MARTGAGGRWRTYMVKLHTHLGHVTLWERLFINKVRESLLEPLAVDGCVAVQLQRCHRQAAFVYGAGGVWIWSVGAKPLYANAAVTTPAKLQLSLYPLQTKQQKWSKVVVVVPRRRRLRAPRRLASSSRSDVSTVT